MKKMLARSIISRFERLGLQRRIMLYVTGGLIVVMAAYSAVSLQAVSQSTNLVFRERLMVAGTVAQQIDSDLSHMQGELNNIGETVGTDLANNQQAKAQQAMQGLRQHWSSYDQFGSNSAIILTNPKGAVVWSDPPSNELPSVDFSNSPSFRAAVQSLQPAIADEISPSADGHGSLWMATPILESGQIEGVMLGELNLSQVSLSFAPLLEMNEPGYSLELIDNQGMVLASLESERQWKLSEHYPIIKDLITRQQAGTATHLMPANSSEPTHIVAFVPLRGVPWGVTLEEPQDLALTLPHALENQLLFFGAIVLLMGLLLARATTRAVVRPVNALIDATQHIASGDLDHPLDVAAEDEVGRLARSFDEMRVELKQSREEIARWNRELETRVHKRTRELSALVKSSHALAATLNLDVLFEILINETREVVPSAEGIVFFLFDNIRELLVVRSTFGFDAAECQQLGFCVGEGIAGQVFEAQSAVRLGLAEEIRAAQSNLSAENYACFQRAIGERPVKSTLGAPLVSKGARLGALVLYNLSREEAFTDNDVTVLQAFANQATAAIENARLYASLQEKEAERAALLEQAIQAQEEERARVAREIHDELGQLLTRLSIDLKMCETQVAAEPKQAAQTLAATQTLVWQTIEQAHHLIVELRPTLLDELGLDAALREELATRLEPLGVITSLEADDEPERLPPSVEIAVFRIVQEAISNIARHAHAQHAKLSLHTAGMLQVSIEDDGVGIRSDWHDGADGHRPLGLLGMQERAVLIGGTLTIEPGAPQGTRVTLRVPLSGNAPLEKRVK
jgi:signal transduction histidine kinase/HAMP domain-containing protein